MSTKFAEMLARQKADALAKPAAETALQTSGAFSLRGTGITKKAAEKASNEYERDAAKSMKLNAAQQASADMFAAKLDTDIQSIQINTPSDLTLDPSQEAALLGMSRQQFCVLIGAAGTGKTTLERMLLKQLELQAGVIDVRRTYFETQQVNEAAGIHKRERKLASDVRKPIEVSESGVETGDKTEYVIAIACAAYTGRAVQQMKRALPKEYHRTCSTIHALLGYAPVEEEYINAKGEYDTHRVFRPSFGKTMKLPYKIYVFDEAGMIPVQLWNEFIDACPDDARIVLIGDINQLPPVHGKGVLGYAMARWPVYELTKIHRQAADNPIIANAHNILNGKFPVAVPKQFDIIGSPIVPDSGEKAAQVLYRAIKGLHESGQFNPLTDAIIVPTNKNALGQATLNEKLVTMFNPEKEVNGVILNKRINIHTGTDHMLYATGDKVMLLSNDNERGLTNGMIGVIESINLNGRYDNKRAQVDLEGSGSDEIIDLDGVSFDDLILTGSDNDDEDAELSRDQRQSSHVTTVKFVDGQEATFSTAGDYRKITHAYAFTCHKSQGGEYPTVVIMLHSANANMLTREWLYTAVTRARERVIILKNDYGLQKAIARQVIQGRTLEEKIRSYQVASDVVFNADTENVDRNKFPILWPAREIEQ